MQIPIRKFSNHGMLEFEYLLTKFRAENKIDDIQLNKLLFDDLYSSSFEQAEPIILEMDNNKYNIAKLISESLKLVDHPELDKDKGLWTWLSALMLKRLVKVNPKTNELKFSSDNSLYIYNPSYNRYYRHLIAFPCLIYTRLGEVGEKIFLRGTIDERGELVEQLAANQEIQRNSGAIESATLLYYDELTGKIKKGAAGQANEKIGGQAHRLRDVLKQFTLTYDLNAMNGKQIVELLPREFDRWKKRYHGSEEISVL